MPIGDAPITMLDNTPKPGKKYFTVAEANRSLPYVSRIVEDIVLTYGQVVQIRHELQQRGQQPGSGTASEELEATYDELLDRLSDLVDELCCVGIELKDFEKGLIDFPALHEGREVLLCWRRGEHEVAHWHEVDAGFAGRQSVKLLSEAALH
ncbi:MAG TPA: DUF2203 domain-containing protein [Phycisphaeraceae bacterium]